MYIEYVNRQQTKMVSLDNRGSVMILYSDSTGAMGHSVRIVLAEKDINAEVNYIRDDTHPQELADLNPYNTVPTLVDRDLVLYDARTIMEYLDERFPHPPLLPVDPVSRAANRQLRFRIAQDLYALVDDLDSDNDIAAAGARKSLHDNLTAIAPTFSQLPYFMSEDYTLADCCLAPLLWRLETYGIKLPAGAAVIHKYAESLFERDAFQASMSESERDMRTK